MFPTTEKEKKRVAIIKEVGDILQSVYRKPKARYEVNATIKTEYYVDERVLLKDLLFPESSPLYTTEKFRASGSEKGVFKRYFFEALDKGSYPSLKTAMGFKGNNTRQASEGEGIDPTNEIWTNEYGISIYFPYSENFPLINPNDPNNNTANGNLVTIVSADREAESGPGWKPYFFEPGGGFQCPDNICWRPVTVDDDYAEFTPTHIVGVGAEPLITQSINQGNQVYVVFIGEVKCTHQFDHFISLHNGGGSELRFTRGDAYLQQNTNGQITNFQNLISVNIKRKDIKHGNWKTVNQIWDANWEIDNTEQIFGIYEEDKQESQTFSGTLTTTLVIPGSTPPSTIAGQYGYSVTVQTQDDIIRQLNWNRTSFYTYNQGGLNNGCGTRNGWTVYDCNSYVMYNMPTQ